MKNLRIIIIAMIPLLLLSTGCYKEGGIFGIKGTGSTQEEERFVNSFDKIDMGISADIILTQDQDESIVIEAQGNILDNIETYVKGNTLKIRFKRNVLWHNGIKIFISNPEYTGLEISGSGSIVNDNPLSSYDLDLQISGSGYLELDDVTIDHNLDQTVSGSGEIHIDKLEVGNDIRSDISGSGKIFMEGTETADYMKIGITGSGELNSLKFPVDKVDAHISGSGECRIWVISELDATITGSGSVFYKGNPSVNTVITGSGRVSQIN